MQQLKMFWVLGVPQRHQQHNHSIDFKRNYATILYRVRVIASYLLKVNE